MTQPPSPLGASLPVGLGLFQCALDWQLGAQQLLLQMQKTQIQYWEDMRQTGVAAQRELWDQWIARFGGGVPLD